MDSFECDILIFIATSSEADAIRKAAKERNIPFKMRRHQRLGKYAALGTIGNSRVLVVKTELGSLKYGGSASRGINAMSFTTAAAIVQIGMAFGISRNDQLIGDVLVSTEIIPYDARRINTHPSDPTRYVVDYSDSGRFASSESMISLFRGHEARKVAEHKVLFGAMLSGGARIFCQAFLAEVMRTAPGGDSQIIGGEMEGAGLLSISESDSPAWIIVKGISDFADDHRHSEIEASRQLACDNAARFVLAAIAGQDLEVLNVTEDGVA